MANNLLISTLGEIADYLGVGRNTTKRWIDNEGLPAFQSKKNGPYRVRLHSLKSWLEDFEQKYKKTPP